jgi:hypothetical protein
MGMAGMDVKIVSYLDRFGAVVRITRGRGFNPRTVQTIHVYLNWVWVLLFTVDSTSDYTLWT